MKKLIWVAALLVGVRAWCPPGGPVTTPPGVANECPSNVSEGANCSGYERQWCVNYTTAIIYSCNPTTHVWMAVGSAGGGSSGVTNGNKGDITVSNAGGTWLVNADSVGMTELSDVTLTSPATGAVLIKGSPDWVDGQVNLADTDAVTGLLPAGNIDTTIARDSEVTAALASYQPLDTDDLSAIAALNVAGCTAGNVIKASGGTWVCGTDDTIGGGAVTTDGNALTTQLAYFSGTSVVVGDTGMTVDPATNTITASTFSGALQGNATTATTAGSATSASTCTTCSGLAADLPLTGITTIATDRLLGRDTPATGDIELLTVGGGIEFTGSGGIQRSALSGEVQAAAGGSGTTIQLGVVEPSNLNATTVAGDGLFATKTVGADTFTWAAGTGGSPIDATYITQSGNITLTGEQSLAALGTSGIIKVTNTGGVNGIGVLGIATSTDFPTLNQSTTGSAATVTGTFTNASSDITGVQGATQVVDNSHNHTGAAGTTDTLSGIDITSDTNLGVAINQGLTLTSGTTDNLALQSCAQGETLVRNASSAWVCGTAGASFLPTTDPGPDATASLIYVGTPGTGGAQTPMTDAGLTYDAVQDQLNAGKFASAQTTTPGSLALYEGSAGGTTFWTLQAPANLAQSTAVTGGSYTVATNTCVLNNDGTIPDACVGDGTDGGASLADGDKGDITVSGSGAAWAIDDDSVQPSDLDDAGSSATGYVPVKAATDVFTWTPMITVTETSPAAGHTLVWENSTNQYINKLVGNCTGASDALTFNVSTLTWGCHTITVGGGMTFDIGDDGGNDSVTLTEIATTGDTNNIFTESAEDKLLIAVGNKWPTATQADDLSSACVNCIGSAEISGVVLGTDTSGTYVATVTSTTNEVTATTVGADVTVSLPVVIDLGGKTRFEIPNNATPSFTPNLGELMADDNYYGSLHAAPLFYNGTSQIALVGTELSPAACNGCVPKWNTGGTITWQADANTGGAPAFGTILTGINTGAVMTIDTGASLVFNTTTAGTAAITGTDTLAGLTGSAGANLAANALTVGTTGIIFEGTTANGFQTLITPGDPAADRTITLPNLSGTVSLTDTPQTVTGANTFTTNGIIWNTTTGGTAGMTGTDTLAGLSSALLAANAVTVGTTGLIFEGTTSNASQGLITAGEPAADRTWTLPDLSGTFDFIDAAQTITAAKTYTTSGIVFNTTTGGTAGMTGTDTLAGLSSALLPANAVTVGTTGIIFEGTTSNGSQSLLTAGEPTADNTFTLPLAVSGTLISTGDTGTVTSTMIATEVRSMYWGAGSLSVDGTQCAAPTEVTINSGPKLYTIICTDNDSSTIYGSTHMPDSWDGGTVTFSQSYIQTAANTSALNGDIAAQCRGNGEVPSSTWGTEVAIDDAAVVGSNSNDITTSAAVTPAGTCAAGDMLYWRWQLDATGTTTAVATLNFVGFKMEYTTTVGD